MEPLWVWQINYHIRIGGSFFSCSVYSAQWIAGESMNVDVQFTDWNTILLVVKDEIKAVLRLPFLQFSSPEHIFLSLANLVALFSLDLFSLHASYTNSACES